MDFSDITTSFFKRRFVFNININNFENLNFDEKNSNISFEYMSKTNFCKVIDIYESSEDNPMIINLKNRLNYPEIWRCVIALLDGKPVGCHWILLPLNNNLFYDSFEFDNKSALFCGVYVNPNYRGKRIYNSMQCFVYNMWINDFPYRNVITIVEEKNKSSLKSNLRIGLKVKGANYLLKFFGKNVISIFHQYNYKIQIWNVIKRKNENYDAKSSNNF